MQAPVYDLQGKVVEHIEISDDLFSAVVSPAMVHQALLRQRANARVGTASTKTRGEMRGGGKKPWPQKGTGRARAGSTRSPLWRGGGKVFGPKPRDYHQDMPKKMRRAAIKSCLTDKAANNHLFVLQSLALEKPETKEVLRVLSSLGLSRSTLLVTKNADQTVVRSARNISWVRTLPANLLNVGDLVSHGSLVMTVDAVRRAEEIWARPQDAADATEGGD